MKDSRHFILVHGYNTNREEARGNAAEFYKKMWQSGSGAMFTAVEWRGDQFGLPDEAKTSAQHYVTVEGDDTIRVFDNGNGRDPQLTRIMQYVINTNEMTATPTVLYAPADKFSAMCGSAQVLDDGMLVIGWGGATRDADCLSVITNGVTQMRVTLADPTDFTYRAVYCALPPPGSKGNPWVVGEGVKAWTNGTELVIGGKGPVALTLPDGWQGELPDEKGSWYGATGVTMAKWPLAVKNVTSQQRYPWNGLVDVSCDLMGSGTVTLNVTVLTNGVKFIAKPTIEGGTTVDLDAAGGVTNGVKFIWNAAEDLPAGFKAGGVQVKVTVGQ